MDRGRCDGIGRWVLSFSFPVRSLRPCLLPSLRPRWAGIKVNVTPHTFRRSCATEMLRDGANMYHVKDLLGHESLDTLKPYVLLTITDLKKEHARFHPREKDGCGQS